MNLSMQEVIFTHILPELVYLLKMKFLMGILKSQCFVLLGQFILCLHMNLKMELVDRIYFTLVDRIC
jgi:hypothetical protein